MHFDNNIHKYYTACRFRTEPNEKKYSRILRLKTWTKTLNYTIFIAEKYKIYINIDEKVQIISEKYIYRTQKVLKYIRGAEPKTADDRLRRSFRCQIVNKDTCTRQYSRS